MLVFNRKKDQAVIITAPGFPPIRVLVVEARNGRFRLGFSAPDSVVIDREEVYVSKARIIEASGGGHAPLSK